MATSHVNWRATSSRLRCPIYASPFAAAVLRRKLDEVGLVDQVPLHVIDDDRPFDLGPSLKHENWTVNEILVAGLPVSMTLGLVAILLACIIGITAGVLGGIRPGSWTASRKSCERG